ncbi:MAG: nucleotidyltransferase domain-containing protein [Oscillospiraceae bacterium]|nr:nucleotidyltransferase domain-containing protein [Oscillospiraceae bacterium]
MDFLHELDIKLSELERRENIRILHCIESGSRAWGFESPDSDYDVRFIYARPRDFYLRLDKTRDVIEWQLDDVWDMNGWDIKKALQLLHKSNPTMFEWNSSPIVYRTTVEWQSLNGLIDRCFCSKPGAWHYLSMAKRNFREFLSGEEVKLKKYFYVLRPVLACKWIIEKGTPPPMLFTRLSEDMLEDSLKGTVNDLLKLKMESPELGSGRRIDVLNDYIEEQLAVIEERLAALPDSEPCGWGELNEAFLNIIG